MLNFLTAVINIRNITYVALFQPTHNPSNNLIRESCLFMYVSINVLYKFKIHVTTISFINFLLFLLVRFYRAHEQYS